MVLYTAAGIAASVKRVPAAMLKTVSCERVELHESFVSCRVLAAQVMTLIVSYFDIVRKNLRDRCAARAAPPSTPVPRPSELRITLPSRSHKALSASIPPCISACKTCVRGGWVGAGACAGRQHTV